MVTEGQFAYRSFARALGARSDRGGTSPNLGRERYMGRCQRRDPVRTNGLGDGAHTLRRRLGRRLSDGRRGRPDGRFVGDAQAGDRQEAAQLQAGGSKAFVSLRSCSEGVVRGGSPAAAIRMLRTRMEVLARFRGSLYRGRHDGRRTCSRRSASCRGCDCERRSRRDVGLADDGPIRSRHKYRSDNPPRTRYRFVYGILVRCLTNTIARQRFLSLLNVLFLLDRTLRSCM